MPEQKPCVLHVAAAGDEEALETLCRTTPIIAAAGATQVLLAIDDGRGADVTWSAAVVAEVRPLRCAGLSILGRLQALQSKFAELFLEKSPYAVHLHGIGPCLLGSRALKRSALQARVLCSPHGKYLGSWGSALLGRLLQRQLSPLNYAALAASLTEAQALSKLLNRSAEVLPHPVSDVFFAAPRCEDARPSIVADGMGAEAINLITRLCVLLNGRAARVPFAWVGAAEGKAGAQLEAGNVEVLGVADDAERAQCLSRASIFLHVSLGNALPLAVAQAMAAGVPCLVSDTPSHRALIRHGETGFICTSERDFLERLVLLLRDRGERRRLGEAARAEAERCFTLRHFESALLRAYGFFSNRPAPAVRVAGPLPSSVPH